MRVHIKSVNNEETKILIDNFEFTTQNQVLLIDFGSHAFAQGEIPGNLIMKLSSMGFNRQPYLKGRWFVHINALKSFKSIKE